MKKTLLVIINLFFVIVGNAQMFPYAFQPVLEVPYYPQYDYHETMIIDDSSVYTVRSRGLHIKNLITGMNEYRWKNHYNIQMILPDNNGNYIFLSSSSYIGKYDSILNDYVNINNGPLATSTISRIGISPNGNIWAAGYQTFGIYDGATWQTFSYNGSISNLKVIDDTSAYIKGNVFMRFHNGIFDTLSNIPNISVRDWDIDSQGNLWMATVDKLIRYNDTTITYFDSTNTPVGSEKFYKVIAGKNGHVWTCGEKRNLFEYDGTNWAVHALPGPYIYIDNFSLDSLSRPLVIGGSFTSLFPNPLFNYMNIYAHNGTALYNFVNFPFMPYINIKAISGNSIANDEGVFRFDPNNANFRLYQYSGAPAQPEASDVNCFLSSITNQSSYPYGTNSGIYNTYGPVNGLDTAALPNDTVNSIYYDNGSYYVATNKGLLVYNGVFYNTYDATNSPLPSNKITFVTISHDFPYNKLYVGTDNGVAIYSNSQWTVFDSTDLGLNIFNVTGILPAYYDTVTYVSTLGSGLIKLFDSGGYEILNTVNGNFLDDSLYYVIRASLGACGEYVLIGTKNNGIAVYDYWSNPIVEYYDSINGYPIIRSRAAYDNTYMGGIVMIGTETGIFWASPCGAIEETGNSQKIKVYPNPTTGTFTISTENVSDIEIHNIVGELIYKTKSTDQHTTIDLSTQAKGIYFIRSTDLNKRVSNKKIIIQ